MGLKKGTDWFNSLSIDGLKQHAKDSVERFVDIDKITEKAKESSFLNNIGDQFAMEGLQGMIDASVSSQPQTERENISVDRNKASLAFKM